MIFTSDLKHTTMSTKQPLALDIYVNYPGHCESAFRFYEQHLGGRITLMSAHQQVPPHFPAEWSNPILHAIVEIGGTILRGADVPNAEPMRSVYLTLRVDTADKAEELYELLSADGQVFMKMEKTFFANRFAMLRDRFGTSWMILHEPSA
ncbi:MAG: hypothetical protein JWP27_757 [Flaviaesturariibacter sp.]|nr:hypothetical protein [Flaviaesturariibacter sp.]